MELKIKCKSSDDREDDVKGMENMANNRSKMFELAKKEGYTLKRTKGSHYIYENEEGMILVIPFHSHEVTTGMIRRVERDIESNKRRPHK